MTLRRVTALAAALCLVVGVSGCTIGDLPLRHDHRLSFTSPASGALVRLPLTVSWTMKDFTVTGSDGRRVPNAGLFAVFVDQTPIRAKHELRDVASGDRGCLRNPACPDAAYLADRHVFTTSDPQITIPTFAAPTSKTGPDRHTVTVVLLDGTGRRAGESAWRLTVQLPRQHR